MLLTSVSLLAPTLAPGQNGEAEPLAGLAPASNSGQLVDAASSSGFEGASISWEETPPAPGTVVKLKVRGETLAYLLREGATWELVSGETRLAAQLVSASLPEQISKQDYSLLATETGGGKTLQLEIDRGDGPLPLNRLEIQFAASSYFGKATVLTSADQENYRIVGRPQVVFQEISGGQVYRLGELKLDQNLERYLRIELPKPASGTVQTVKGWFVADHKLVAYKAQAALGPMREGQGPGESVWPILMNPGNLPIAKLKVLADAPGELRRMHLATMDGTSIGAQVGGAIIWASNLTQGSKIIANKWMSITGEPASGPFAIVVSGDASPLQLSGVEVYLLEHWLLFEMPEDGGLQLWQTRVDGSSTMPPDSPPLNIQNVEFAGTITDWDTPRPPQADKKPSRNWISQPPGFATNGGWQAKMYSYLALALVLCITGVVLLRRELRGRQQG